MAGESVVGALRVILGMDTAQYEDKLKKADKSTSDFAKSAKVLGAAIGASIAAAGTGIAIAVKSAINEADKLGKMAQAFGIPVEQLSALKHAADLSDVSLEQLGTGVGRLSRNMAEAAKGTGQAVSAFKALGISVTDANTGALRPTTEVMADIADRFVKMEDGAGKTALAIQIFGRAGAQLIPLLNQGGAALRDMAKEAVELGIVIDTRTAKAAEEFNDTLTRIGKVWDGITIRIAAEMLPTLQAIASTFFDVAKNTQIAEVAGQTLSAWLREGTVLVISMQAEWTKFNLVLANMQALWSSIVNLDARAFWRAFIEGLFGAKTNLAEVNNEIAKFRMQADVLSKLSPFRFEGGPEAIELTSRLNKEVAPIAENVGKAKRQYSELGDQIEKSAGLGAKIRQELATPFDEINKKIAETQFAFSVGSISAEAFFARMQQLAIQTATAWGNVAQSIVSPMADAFKTLASMNKQYAGVAKGLAIAEALINTYLAATKALASGVPPFNYIAAAAVTAAGLANVAKIQATEFAQGGSFRVGGVGGIDSQLVQFKATPGEMVDVRKPGQTSPSTVNLTLTGDRVRADDVRSLIDTINGAIRDGYRINFAV